MNIFNLITLLGGLAMFLYGMRLMSGSLKESSSGALKQVMERVTNNPVKAFLLGIAVTAVIQSSTATIVITSGLVAAGVLTLRQSLGIIVGANVGTTVTGQIIRLLDLNATSTAWLEVFKPSTLAPLALVAGIVLLMFCKFKKSDEAGHILLGFGILFSGLMNMTGAVTGLTETEGFRWLYRSLGESALLGYLCGAAISFVLQSSSAAIGILQAFSMAGALPFKAVYPVLVGIYLGDCVTTAIVCSIGARADARRVGIVNILFNLCKSVLVLAAVAILHRLHALDGLWERELTSGGIANSNTVFNLGCALLLFPLLGSYEKLACKLVKDDPTVESPYAGLLEALNPVFFSTPALAFRGVYHLLLAMFRGARENFSRAIGLFSGYDEGVFAAVSGEEDAIDTMADHASNYLAQLSAHISEDYHVRIMDEYYKLISEFERLGDHAMNIAEAAQSLHEKNTALSDEALRELGILSQLIGSILDYAERAFEKRDEVSAGHIEPLEEVVDDMISALRDNHLKRLHQGLCNVFVEHDYLNLLSDIERISDICSNVGIATLTRVKPELADVAHEYMTSLHKGQSERFNEEYGAAHDYYFGLLEGKESR